MANQIIVASNNGGKIFELQQILGEALDANIVSAASVDAEYEAAEETETTFLDNALLKARHAYEHFKAPVIADDSGLEVIALGGEPGVLSARYSGDHDDEANNEKLLKNLSEYHGKEERKARFVSVVVYIDADGNEFVGEGDCEGYIADEARGQNGFGYDPLFVANAYDPKTFAEVSDEEKNSVSHRSEAIQKLKETIK